MDTLVGEIRVVRTGSWKKEKESFMLESPRWNWKEWGRKFRAEVEKLSVKLERIIEVGKLPTALFRDFLNFWLIFDVDSVDVIEIWKFNFFRIFRNEVWTQLMQVKTWKFRVSMYGNLFEQSRRASRYSTFWNRLNPCNCPK